MKSLFSIFVAALATLSAIFIFHSSSPETPVTIGFLGGMSGRSGDLGVAGRNGALLAVEDRNRKGGLFGQPVRLISRDDGQDPETAISAVKELHNKGVKVIIGPMTSSIAMALTTRAGVPNTLLVSPTATTTRLEGINDQFIRVLSTTRQYAIRFADFQYTRLGVKRVAAIYDIGNRAYTEDWLGHFQGRFNDLGGQIVARHAYVSHDNAVFYDAVKALLEKRPDGILIVTNAVDAGIICQQIRKLAPKIIIAMSEWASTDSMERVAGNARNRAYITQFVDRNDTSPRYKAFCARFEKRFGKKAIFASVTAYDATSIVLDAFLRADGEQNLKQRILSPGQYQGLQQKITLNPYGDADRDSFIFQIIDGTYHAQEN
ncbi:MAG: ABC transporter substrate-binding protein [Desulfobacterales bacterium]|nr:ABC transporter substrate-binding protein [Desulfobacterales bacterium]